VNNSTASSATVGDCAAAVVAGASEDLDASEVAVDSDADDPHDTAEDTPANAATTKTVTDLKAASFRWITKGTSWKPF
jgi:hypothetical protein